MIEIESENNAVVVAATAVQVIGELSRMLYEGFPHDEKSEAMVTTTCAMLTSVIDGKLENPGAMAASFDMMCHTVDRSLLDEVSRCQHFLTDALEKVQAAESRALANELYASWYLRLRDGASKDLEVVNPYINLVPIRGEALDIAMEDLDGDPGNDIDKP